MKYKDIIKYKKMLLNNEQNSEIFKNKSAEEIKEIFKYCEVDLNKEKYKKIYANILRELSEIEKDKITKFEESSRLYNDIKDILKDESFNIKQIKDTKALGGIILMTHLHFIFSEYCKENTDGNAEVRELIVDYFNIAIKSYLNVKNNIMLLQRVNKININCILLDSLYKRLNSFSAYQKVIELLEMYRYNFVDFKLKNKLVQLDFNPKYDVLSRVIASQDFCDKHNVNNMFITEEFDEKEEGVVFHDEKVYRKKMQNFFMTDDLSIKMGDNFTISEWIKIFMILVKVNVEYWRENRYTLLIKTYDEWIKIFEENGFKREKAEKILNELTFSIEDTDIREKPMILYKNIYVTVPSFIATIDVYEVLIHIFNSRNYQLNFKGAYFEEQFRKDFEKIGIKNCTCKVGQKECDMAFIFDECLFICELKNEFQPSTNLEWYRFYKKQEEHIEQLEKIYDFYKINLHYI